MDDFTNMIVLMELRSGRGAVRSLSAGGHMALLPGAFIWLLSIFSGVV